jgi:outer membrane protein assembly factor BamB
MLWAHTNRARFFQWQGGEGPRATPTVDGGRVYALGGTGILDCLEAATGRRVWSRDVLVENGIPNLTWGASASPLVVGDVVVVTGGMTNRSTVLAYHRGTGEPLWQAGGDKASYASPVLAELVGRRLVLSVNAGSLTGHDPATGVVELDVAWGRDNRPKATQPVVLDGDRVFLSAGYAEGCVMLRVKAGAGGRLEAEELWRNKRMKTQFNTAVHVGGSLYGLDDGLLACVDAVTGERLWKDGRYGAGQSVVVEDVVLVQSERGPVVMVAAEREGFRELGRLAGLDSKTWNYPALAGRYLLIRNDREAVCYELPVAVAVAVAGAVAGGVSGR